MLDIRPNQLKFCLIGGIVSLRNDTFLSSGEYIPTLLCQIVYAAMAHKKFILNLLEIYSFVKSPWLRRRFPLTNKYTAPKIESYYLIHGGGHCPHGREYT